MIEFYSQIKWVHIIAVLCSGALFFFRGQAALRGQSWPMKKPLRYASFAIDSVLMLAALMLVTMLPIALFANGWLVLKLVLLMLYIAFGWLALWHGRTPHQRYLFFVAALLTYLFIIGIARAHHPLGWIHLISG